MPLPDDPAYKNYQDSLRPANYKIPGFCANGGKAKPPQACNSDP